MKKIIENLQPPEVIQNFLDVNEEWAQTYRRKLYAICVKPNGVLVGMTLMDTMFQEVRVCNLRKQRLHR